jgi:signal transduction histidine kinase
MSHRSFTLQRALLGAIAASVLAGIVPAGIAFGSSLWAAMESRARDELKLAAGVSSDRFAAKADAMMMYAKEFANTPGLADALAGTDSSAGSRAAEGALSQSHGIPVIIGPDGKSWHGPSLSAELVARTRAGQMPVTFVSDGNTVWQIAIAPVERAGQWQGAAGFAVPIDDSGVSLLSGLTRTGVLVVPPNADNAAATTLDTAQATSIIGAVRAEMPGPAVRDISLGGRRILASAVDLEGAGLLIFVRALDTEYAMLPRLRFIALASAAVALMLALALGVLLARRMARPVAQLAEAASAMTEGDFESPLPDSRIREVARVATAFGEMRRALVMRLEQLRTANTALADAGSRLRALQSDLLQRERLAATGRLVVQLSHEIRNPVANVRNCLELVRRRVADDPEARDYADLAIDELLRMHALAEHVLDANRPSDEALRHCQPVLVARDVAALSTAGISPAVLEMDVEGPASLDAAIAPDALKQVLFSIVQNAREAMDASHTPRSESPSPRIEIRVASAGTDVVIEVVDTGPGLIPDDIPRIFDPFFTTKRAVHGVGLGLFVAEGLIRAAGGQLTAHNRDAGGACFRIVVPGVSGPAIAERVESDLSQAKAS